MKLARRSSLYALALLLVCIFDPVAFSAQLLGFPKLPFGLAGIALTLLLAVDQVHATLKARKFAPLSLWLAGAFALYVGTALTSRYFSTIDVWITIENLAYVALGAFACAYASYGLSLLAVTAGALALGASGALWYLFADRIFVTGEIGALNYLYVCDSMAVLGIVLYAQLRNRALKIPFAAFTALCLYFVGSRFAFFGFAAAAFFLVLRDTTWFKRGVICVVAAASLSAVSIYIESLNFGINDNRFVRLLMFTENDTSLNLRLEDDQYSRDIFERDVLGGGGYRFHMNRGEGTYAHNVLSAVYENGLLGIFLLAPIALLMLKSLRPTHNVACSDTAAGLVLFFGMACFSKYYMWWGYYFIVGYLLMHANRACGNTDLSFAADSLPGSTR